MAGAKTQVRRPAEKGVEVGIYFWYYPGRSLVT